jgi:LysM repeat protein
MGSGSFTGLFRRSAFGLLVGWALLGILLAFARNAAAVPSEEDIGASPAQARPAETDNPVPAAVEAAPARPNSDATEGMTSATTHVRASFPYWIRSGDTLGSIAEQFGISVADLTRANHISEAVDLIVGHTLRIPNPSIARERAMDQEIDRLSLEKQAAEQKATKAASSVGGLRAQIRDLRAASDQDRRDLRVLPWWRGAAVSAGLAALLMLGAMLLSVVEWLQLRSRFRAAAEMNESLRRLDYKYKAALAKAELRLQELYGRRRRGIQDGQERPRIPEEAEIEQLSRQLKEILEENLQRLGPPNDNARRARWREVMSGVGAPVEARSARR